MPDVTLRQPCTPPAKRHHAAMVQIHDVTLSGPADLTAQLFAPDAPQKVAVLNGATGVPKGYYRSFATWMAQERNTAVLIYDYRDFASSLRGSTRDSTATMADWGIIDQQVARDWLAARYPDLPLWVIGHSLGGFMFARQKRLDQIARIITVGSGEVHLSDHPWPYRAVATSFWWGHGPIMAGVMGYLPGRALGIGADIPLGVFRQWRKWCTTRGFTAMDPTLPAPSLDGLTAPVRVVSLSDDNIGTHAAADRLASHLGPNVERLRLRPQDAGLSKVGHIAAFARSAAPLWPLLVD